MSNPTTPISIRRARPSDAKYLASLHVLVWRATYRDYAPTEAIAKLDAAHRLPYWEDALAGSASAKGVLVAEQNGNIQGVISFAPAAHKAFNGQTEIKHFYVALDAQGQGIGRRLLSAFLDNRESMGVNGVALAVVEQNEPARQFYKKMGGVEIDKFVDPGPLWKSENIVVVWD